ncbi:unnamed protein product [Cylicostephanus goldi]|uniref:C2 domain-containing protein n=1 Tax=Cylicostephanus goldi TaxID=71465 RepID=A0A3P6R355_CYLGO|nr:unnamed protein product [Cylicostephanus goldi]
MVALHPGIVDETVWSTHVGDFVVNLLMGLQRYVFWPYRAEKFGGIPFKNEFLQLLIALCYDTDHGCLTVGIERGSSLGDKCRPPDTFIKIVALGEFGNELWRQKTELVKGTSEPQFDHSASIQVWFFAKLLCGIF